MARTPQDRPTDDVSGSFQAARPCRRRARAAQVRELVEPRTGSRIDLNPVENPYVGCGRTHDREAPASDRSRFEGMVTPAVVSAFRSIGWGWGGAGPGDTKDYMHFSSTGH